MAGIGRQMPFTMAAFTIGSLSVIGLPPFGGAWSKWYLALGAVRAEQLVFVGVLMVSTLLNIAYLLPVSIRAFWPGQAAVRGGGDNGGLHEAPLLCVLSLCFTALGCLVLFFFSGGLFRLLWQIVG